MDLVLGGRVAVVEGIDEDAAGGVHFTVTIEGDPGQDLGMARMPGHRFFFRPEEIGRCARRRSSSPASATSSSATTALARGRASAGGPDLGPGVTVKDFGIRGLDLAYAMRGYDAVVFVDAVPGQGEPGTLHVIEADGERRGRSRWRPTGSIRRRCSRWPARSDPCRAASGSSGASRPWFRTPRGRMVGELSEPVRRAVDGAVAEIERRWSDDTEPRGDPAGRPHRHGGIEGCESEVIATTRTEVASMDWYGGADRSGRRGRDHGAVRASLHPALHQPEADVGAGTTDTNRCGEAMHIRRSASSRTPWTRTTPSRAPTATISTATA